MPSSGRARRSRRDPRTSRLVRGLLVVRQMPDHGHRCHTPPSQTSRNSLLLSCSLLLSSLTVCTAPPGRSASGGADYFLCARPSKVSFVVAREATSTIYAPWEPRLSPTSLLYFLLVPTTPLRGSMLVAAGLPPFSGRATRLTSSVQSTAAATVVAVGHAAPVRASSRAQSLAKGWNCDLHRASSHPLCRPGALAHPVFLHIEKTGGSSVECAAQVESTPPTHRISL